MVECLVDLAHVHAKCRHFSWSCCQMGKMVSPFLWCLEGSCTSCWLNTCACKARAFLELLSDGKHGGPRCFRSCDALRTHAHKAGISVFACWPPAVFCRSGWILYGSLRSRPTSKRRLFSTLPQLNTERRVFGLNLLFSQTVP